MDITTLLRTGLLAALVTLSAGLIGEPVTDRFTDETVPEPIVMPTFKVGERLVYQAKVNFLRAGSATMSVENVESIRGKPAYHTVFDVRGKVVFYRVNHHYESWFDTTNLVSLRMTQRIEQGDSSAARNYEFYPERRVYVRNGEERPSVPEPLDEGSFLYFMRSIPLEVGRTYTFNRYYNLERNPVVIKVIRRERVKVPFGEFDAIVAEPVIKSRGLFSENGHAEVWLADDSTHRILRLKSKLSFGTLTLELKTVEGRGTTDDGR
jgi:hypothetical protein